MGRTDQTRPDQTRQRVREVEREDEGREGEIEGGREGGRENGGGRDREREGGRDRELLLRLHNIRK